jgi:sarcosine oxidase subunit gamma
MADSKRSPLIDHASELAAVATRSGGQLTVSELPLRVQVNVRLDPDNSVRDGVEKVLETPLPLDPNTTVCVGDRMVCWLGPDEWLVVGSVGDEGLAAHLAEATAGQAASVVDVSAARTILRISGPRARALLAHGCALDLHAQTFPVGHCAQTRLALANVLIAAAADNAAEHVRAPEFLVFVRASFAGYVATWLLDAAVEYLDAEPAT